MCTGSTNQLNLQLATHVVGNLTNYLPITYPQIQVTFALVVVSLSPLPSPAATIACLVSQPSTTTCIEFSHYAT